MKFVKRITRVLVLGLALTMLLSSAAFETQLAWLAHPSAGAQSRNAVAPKALPKYVPPTFGAPIGRIGGSTRGQDTETLQVVALAPPHVGLTAKAQPSLYWYLSHETALPVELTISMDRAIEPLLETRLPSPLQSGIQRVPLADYHVRLAPGVDYRWHVSVIYNLQQRSQDVVASGAIKLQEAPQTLQSRLSGANEDRKTYIYAEAGFWYDAISAISELIDAAPRNLGLRHQRAALMEQVHLQEVADYDRQVTGQ